METATVPPALDSAVDAAIAAVTAQVAQAQAVVDAKVAAPAPAAPLMIKGVLVTPETHLFENGVPLLTPTGRPRKKPTTKASGVAPSVTDTAAPDKTAAPAAGGTQAPPVLKETVKATTATVTTAFGKIGLPTAKDEEIDVRTFVTNPAMVELGYGLTLNIGNYESARIDVRISLPCYREETDAAFAFAKKWTEERIQTEVKEIRKIASGTKSNTPF